MRYSVDGVECKCCPDPIPLECSDPEGPGSYGVRWVADEDDPLDFEIQTFAIKCVIASTVAKNTGNGLKLQMDVNPADDVWTAILIAWLKDSSGNDYTIDPDLTRGYSTLFGGNLSVRRTPRSDIIYDNLTQWITDTDLEDRPWRPLVGTAHQWESTHTQRVSPGISNIWFNVCNPGQYNACKQSYDYPGPFGPLVGQWIDQDGILRDGSYYYPIHPILDPDAAFDYDGVPKIYGFPNQGLWDDRPEITRWGLVFGMTSPKPAWTSPLFPGQGRSCEDIENRSFDTVSRGGVWLDDLCINVDYIENCQSWFIGRDTVTLTFTSETDPDPPPGEMQFFEPLELRGVSTTLQRQHTDIELTDKNGNVRFRYNDTAFAGSITFPVTRVIDPGDSPEAIGNDQLPDGTRVDIVYVPCRFIRLRFTGPDCDSCDTPAEVYLRTSVPGGTSARTGPSWDIGSEASYDPLAVGYRRKLVNADSQDVWPGEPIEAGCPECDRHCALEALKACGYTFVRHVTQIAGAFEAVAAEFYLDITA